MIHQSICRFKRGSFNPLNAVFGRARRHRRVIHNLRCVLGAFLRRGVEGKDYRVARFQGNQRFENGSRGRVGGRRDAANHADRLGNQRQPGNFVLADHADGFGVAHVIDDMLAGEQVFRRLVLENAAPRFLMGVFGEHAVLVQRRHRRLGDDVVHLFLIELAELFQRFQATTHQCVNVGFGFDLFVGFGVGHDYLLCSFDGFRAGHIAPPGRFWLRTSLVRR